MSEDYIVQQGDCISSIAYAKGFAWKTLWNNDSNSSLKNSRKDPNILMDGDILHIPDKSPRNESCASETKHKFKLNCVPIKFRLKLVRNGKARANESYTLIIDGLPVYGKTDFKGQIVESIFPSANNAMLILRDGAENYSIKLGHLDPLDHPSGLKERLNNLGFQCGQNENDVVASIKEFQKKNGLTADGVANSETKEKIKQAYGA